jgi:hypothetical protein
MTELVLVLAVLLVAVVMGLSLAHALEFPGKLRLGRDAYLATQTIYYPGFTVGGMVGEAGGLIVLALALLLTPTASDRFPWIVAALVLLVLEHATYWLVTHPVNGFWLKDTPLKGAGATFFSTASTPETDWTRLRDRWEWSHVARAALATASLVALAIGLLRSGVAG